MDYKDFIKPGNKVIFYPKSFDWDWSVEQQIVTIGEYRPYFRDGSPDPTPEQYDDSCYVEIVEHIADEKQIRLEDLFPIEPICKQVVFDGKLVEQIGKNDELEKAVLLYGDDWLCVDGDTIDEYRTVYQLDREELHQLFNGCCIGSMYTTDYRNELGIPADEAMAEIEEFCEENGWDDDKCRAHNFADWVLGEE